MEKISGEREIIQSAQYLDFKRERVRNRGVCIWEKHKKKREKERSYQESEDGE